jgi:DNA-binding NarL/FixJ family response regulator
VAASVVASMVRDQATHAERRRAARHGFGLTEREQDVLTLVCEGLTNASIAHRLRLTEKTVKNHLNHVFAKLQVRSRTEAVARWNNHAA